MKKNTYRNKFIRNIRKTWKNKLAVTILVTIGIIATKLMNDATFLVFVLIFFGPLFFAGENYIG